MSRIHDALKKAEEDKLAGKNPVAHPALDELIAPVEEPIKPSPMMMMAAESLESKPATQVSTDPAAENLLERVTKAHWRPNRAVSLFLETHSQVAPGMEEFRTLRARLFQIRANVRSRPSSFPVRCRTKERVSFPATWHKSLPAKAAEERY